MVTSLAAQNWAMFVIRGVVSQPEAVTNVILEAVQMIRAGGRLAVAVG